MARIMIAIGSLPGVRVWRQNSGKILIKNSDGTTRCFDAGPPKGAADISGIVSPGGWRIEIECKVNHRMTPEQEAWRKNMTDAGAIYVLATYNKALSIEDNVKHMRHIIVEKIEERRSQP